MICSILAATPFGGIGNRGTLPWPKQPEDLRWFRQHTLGHVVVMGRKTWDDPLMPKPLADRVNCVASSKPLKSFYARRLNGDILEEVSALEKDFPNKNIFIIGGKSIYESTEKLVQRVYLTRIKGNYFADTRIDLDRYLACFRIKTVRPGQECTYEIWDRVLF